MKRSFYTCSDFVVVIRISRTKESLDLRTPKRNIVFCIGGSVSSTSKREFTDDFLMHSIDQCAFLIGFFFRHYAFAKMLLVGERNMISNVEI